MKIAVAYENGMVSQHFGHTTQFVLYEVEDQKIVSKNLVETNGTGHGLLADFLRENGVTTLICGRIGGGAQVALREAGIRWFGGVEGNADASAQALLDGTLDFDPLAQSGICNGGGCCCD